MAEKRSVKEIYLINQAAKELGISSAYLKLTQEGIVLVNYPMIVLGNPAKELVERDKKNIEHLVTDLKADIHFIISPATPFRDKSGKFFSVKHNMLSAFFNMVELKNYYPQLEILMPEGIVDIKPGLSYRQTTHLSNNINFLGKKYIPPFASELADQFGITYQLKSPRGKNVYTHTILHEFRK